MLAAAGLAATAVGLALTAVVPLNKALWTASFALVASGTGVLLWMMLAKAVRSKVGLRLLSLPLFAGRTALTLYVLHMLLIAILVRKVGGETVWSATYRAFEQLGLPGGIASLAFAMTAAAISLSPVPWLRRHGLLIRA
jgi:predicted acyltransferase